MKRITKTKWYEAVHTRRFRIFVIIGNCLFVLWPWKLRMRRGSNTESKHGN